MAKKVLIVEDTEDIRYALRQLIEIEGCEASAAADADEAITLARTLLPDLILMDLAMPGYDGVHAARAIRSDAKTCEIPILAITSYGRKYYSAAIAAGCNEVFSKTHFMNNFDELLSKYLNGGC